MNQSKLDTNKCHWRQARETRANRSRLVLVLNLMDLYHTAAMLSLRRKKALFLPGKPSTEFVSGRGLPCKNKVFYSPETQHGRRVIRDYWLKKWHTFCWPITGHRQANPKQVRISSIMNWELHLLDFLLLNTTTKESSTLMHIESS